MAEALHVPSADADGTKFFGKTVDYTEIYMRGIDKIDAMVYYCDIALTQ